MKRKTESFQEVFESASYGRLGLAMRPFSLAPDPAFHFPSRSHREAMEQLLPFFLRKHGLSLVFGDVGSGKTVLSRHIVETLDPVTFRSSLIFNPVVTEAGFLSEILRRLRVQGTLPRTDVELMGTLRSHIGTLSREGGRTVIVVDEAQALSDSLLRFLAGLVSGVPDGGSFYLHVVLFAQQEIVGRLLNPAMRPVRETTALTCCLYPLSLAETEGYILHHLAVAGSDGTIRFTPDAIVTLHAASEGCPRVLNTLCDRSMLRLLDQPGKVVDRNIVKRALQDGKIPIPGKGARWNRLLRLESADA